MKYNKFADLYERVALNESVPRANENYLAKLYIDDFIVNKLSNCMRLSFILVQQNNSNYFTLIIPYKFEQISFVIAHWPINSIMSFI